MTFIHHNFYNGFQAGAMDTDPWLAWLENSDACVLIGDLNSLSRTDASPLQYDRHREALPRYRQNDGISFSVPDQLTATGFTDGTASAGCIPAVPTKIGRKSEQNIPLRPDYCLSRGVEISAQVVRNGELAILSDHYPLQGNLSRP